MSFEDLFYDLFYDLLIEAETGAELNKLIGEINDQLNIAKYTVLEANNLWEDYKREVTE